MNGEVEVGLLAGYLLFKVLYSQFLYLMNGEVEVGLLAGYLLFKVLYSQFLYFFLSYLFFFIRSC
jgi:hypothetical protein